MTDRLAAARVRIALYIAYTQTIDNIFAVGPARGRISGVSRPILLIRRCYLYLVSLRVTRMVDLEEVVIITAPAVEAVTRAGDPTPMHSRTTTPTATRWPL